MWKNADNETHDIIKYEGDNNTFIWKHPREDFNTMTELIVHESQEAIFFMNGQALDLFGAGRHTLETQNIPAISEKITKATNGVTPFHCEVYFINKTIQMGIKWGTPDRIRFIEPTNGIPIDIGACGEMNLAVTNSRKLLVKLVGTMNGIAWGERGMGFTQSIQNSFRPLIINAVKSHLSNTIQAQKIDLFEIDTHLEELSESLRRKILPGFEEYGLTIPQFYINTIALPDPNTDKNFRRLGELHSIQFEKNIALAEQEIIRARRGVAVEQEQTTADLEELRMQREIRRAQTNNMIKEMDGASETRIKEMSGLSEARVMREKGYSQKDLIQADLLKSYANTVENMAILSHGADGAASREFGMAAATVLAPHLAGGVSGVQSDPGAVASNSGSPTASSTAEQICAKCGSKLPEKARFCLECGEQVVVPVPVGMIVCPQCGKTVSKGKFCLECGYKFMTACPKCGADIVDGAKFCLECGTKLNGGL